MINERELNMRLDSSITVWELKRMYPPNHTGETMIRVSDSHLAAISRAIHYVRSGITTQMTEKLRSSIERDIELLDQSHKFIRQQIIEPGLPMTQKPIEVGDIGDTIGNKTSMPPS